MFPLREGRRHGCGRKRGRGQGAVGGHGDGAAGDSRCARCRWRGTRSERPKSLLVVGLLHQHSLPREREDSPCNFGSGITGPRTAISDAQSCSGRELARGGRIAEVGGALGKGSALNATRSAKTYR
jgi:hypothetical protein